MSIFVVFLIITVLILVLILGYILYSNKKLKWRLKREIREADEVLHKTFDLLVEDIQEQIKLLEHTKTKRELTREEEKIIKQLRKNLTIAERFIRKEIKDIEKEVE